MSINILLGLLLFVVSGQCLPRPQETHNMEHIHYDHRSNDSAITPIQPEIVPIEIHSHSETDSPPILSETTVKTIIPNSGVIHVYPTDYNNEPNIESSQVHHHENMRMSHDPEPKVQSILPGTELDHVIPELFQNFAVRPSMKSIDDILPDTDKPDLSLPDTNDNINSTTSGIIAGPFELKNSTLINTPNETEIHMIHLDDMDKDMQNDQPISIFPTTKLPNEHEHMAKDIPSTDDTPHLFEDVSSSTDYIVSHEYEHGIRSSSLPTMEQPKTEKMPDKDNMSQRGSKTSSGNNLGSLFGIGKYYALLYVTYMLVCQ